MNQKPIDHDDIKLDDSELDKFFQSRVWKEIEVLIAINKSDAIRTLSSVSATLEELRAAQGELNAWNFITNIREVLTGEMPKEEAQDV